MTGQWLCWCGNWNLASKEACPLCGRAQPVPLEETPGVRSRPETDQPMPARLSGILTVLGYELDEDDVWKHPFGPPIEASELWSTGRIRNEVALVRRIYESGLDQGGGRARETMRVALGIF